GRRRRHDFPHARKCGGALRGVRPRAVRRGGGGLANGGRPAQALAPLPRGRAQAMSVSPARRAAFEVVRRVFEDDAYADRVLRSASAGLAARERAFAQQLAYGTVQRVRTLDHAIETLGKRPVRKLDAPVLASLRLGAYQLGYTDTPPHAAATE